MLITLYSPYCVVLISPAILQPFYIFCHFTDSLLFHQFVHLSYFLRVHLKFIVKRRKTALMASESSCVYIPGNCQKFPKGILLSKQITGICFFYSVCHEKRSLNQMCISTILLHSLLLYIQTYSVARLHLSDTRLAGLPVGSGNPVLSVTVIFFMVEDSTTCNL